MKRCLAVAFVLGSTLLAGAGSQDHVFRGEISDSQCAMNVHSLSRSHEEMIAKNTFGKDAASCARTCVKRGGVWVLRSGDVVYHLKDQVGVDEFAGQTVEVTGDLDPKTNTIDNIRIEMKQPDVVVK
jgi:hypothetical protein